MLILMAQFWSKLIFLARKMSSPITTCGSSWIWSRWKTDRLPVQLQLRSSERATLWERLITNTTLSFGYFRTQTRNTPIVRIRGFNEHGSIQTHKVSLEWKTCTGGKGWTQKSSNGRQENSTAAVSMKNYSTHGPKQPGKTTQESTFRSWWWWDTCVRHWLASGSQAPL